MYRIQLGVRLRLVDLILPVTRTRHGPWTQCRTLFGIALLSPLAVSGLRSSVLEADLNDIVGDDVQIAVDAIVDAIISLAATEIG